MRLRKSSRKGDRCQLILGWCGTTILLGQLKDGLQEWQADEADEGGCPIELQY